MVASEIIFNALLLVVGLLIFFATVLWTLRETYVHEFRMADMSLYENALQSEVSKKTRAYYRCVALQWLHVSEDYRRTSIYLSMMVANIVVSILFIVASTVLVLLDGLYWFFLLTIGAIFLLITFLDMLILYKRLNPIQAIEKFSWRLAEMFPPLLPFLAPSHLARGGDWKTIQDLIDERRWLRKGLKGLWLHEHLKRLFGYGDSDFFKDFCGRKNPYVLRDT